jgi:transcriptional regulator with XRE-family HTH domain
MPELCDSEINCAISCMWDRGWDERVGGSDSGGWKAETSVDRLPVAARWPADTAAKLSATPRRPSSTSIRLAGRSGMMPEAVAGTTLQSPDALNIGFLEMPCSSADPHINSQIGLRIRRRRFLLHLSQKALGERVQLTPQQVQKYEEGTNAPSLIRLIMLAEALHLPITYFFDGLIREKATSAKSDSPELVERDVRLVHRLHMLPDDVRKSIEKLVWSVARYLERDVSTEPEAQAEPAQKNGGANSE